MIKIIDTNDLRIELFASLNRVVDTEWQKGYWEGVDEVLDRIEKDPLIESESLKGFITVHDFDSKVSEILVRADSIIRIANNCIQTTDGYFLVLENYNQIVQKMKEVME